MADVPVEVKKASPAETTTADVWRSFRNEMDRLFDRFGFPSLRRMFDVEPWRPMSAFSFSVPPIDMSEDDKAYKNSAELPGLDAKDADVSVSGNMLILKGEKRQEKEDKNYCFSERAYASFQRAFELRASVDRDKGCRGFFERGADDHSAEDTGRPEATKENRGQISLIQTVGGGGSTRRTAPLRPSIFPAAHRCCFGRKRA